MTVIVNGQPAEVDPGQTVAGLLARLGHPPGGPGIAVARNGEVVPRSAWSTEGTGCREMSSADTEATEPVRSRREVVPAVTDTDRGGLAAAVDRPPLTCTILSARQCTTSAGTRRLRSRWLRSGWVRIAIICRMTPLAL